MRRYSFSALGFVVAVLLASPLVHAQTTTVSTNSPQAATSTTDTQTIIKLLQEQIKTLLTQVKDLQAKLESTNQQVAAIQTELKINRFLKRGVTGEDVKELQTFLSQFPDIYPEGLVTGYFGALTESAVKKWQEKQGIESVGVVGPKTLARINEIFEQGTGQSGTVPSGLPTAPVIQTHTATTTASSTSTLPVNVATSTVAATTTTTATTTTPQSQSGLGTSVSSTTQAQTTTTTTSNVSQTNTATTSTATNTSQTSTTTSTTSDTSPPSMPTGLVASNTSPDILVYIRVSWTASTDNVGVMGYRVYRNGTQIGSVTGTVYDNPAGLVAGTTYTYTVAAYDAAGNISAQSSSANVTTQSSPSGNVPVLAPPTDFSVQKLSNGPAAEPPMLGYAVSFNYTTNSYFQSYNIYVKRPSDTDFVKHNQTGTYWDNGVSSILDIGEHKFYVTVVNTAGVEGPPTATKSISIYPSPTISTPASGATVSSFQINLVNNATNVSNQHFGVYVFWPGGFWSTDTASLSIAYGGPALNPANNPYRVVVHSYDWDAGGSHFSNDALNYFNAPPAASTGIAPSGTTSSSTASSTSLDRRVRNLAAVSQALSSLSSILERLLNLLKSF